MKRSIYEGFYFKFFYCKIPHLYGLRKHNNSLSSQPKEEKGGEKQPNDRWFLREVGGNA